jgi:hypothetical protein
MEAVAAAPRLSAEKVVAPLSSDRHGPNSVPAAEALLIGANITRGSFYG